MTIVALETLKVAFGIDVDDESQDDVLSAQEARAAAWVEAQTHRRFQEPEAFTEYLQGSGTRSLYLSGNIGDDAGVVVQERYNGVGDWDDVDESRYEQRGNSLVRLDGQPWLSRSEFACTYNNGYEEAPQDIQALVIDLVRAERDAEEGDADATSITLGEYSERRDVSALYDVQAKKHAQVLGRWRRRFV